MPIPRLRTKNNAANTAVTWSVVETGGGKAGFGKGNFYGEPLPQVKLHPPGRRWHAGKVLFEKYWLRRWF